MGPVELVRSCQKASLAFFARLQQHPRREQRPRDTNLPMASQPGKLFPFRSFLRSRHWSHRPYGSHGRAESDNSAGGQHAGGLRYLPALRTEAGAGACGAGRPSGYRGFDPAGVRSAGQASSTNRWRLSQVALSGKRFGQRICSQKAVARRSVALLGGKRYGGVLSQKGVCWGVGSLQFRENAGLVIGAKHSGRS